MTRAIGVDLSHWDVSFDPEKAMGRIDFAIMKASEGIYKDPKFAEIWSGVQKVPIRGAYHYLRSGWTWQKQVDFFWGAVKNYPFHFYVLDFESTGNVLNAGFAAMASFWMYHIHEKAGGKAVLLYTNPNHYTVDLMPYGDWMKNYPLWLAQYYTTKPSPEKAPALPAKRAAGDWKIWQWASEINYPGHGKEYGTGSYSVDLDAYNGTPGEMATWLKAVVPPIPRDKLARIKTAWMKRGKSGSRGAGLLMAGDCEGEGDTVPIGRRPRRDSNPRSRP